MALSERMAFRHKGRLDIDLPAAASKITSRKKRNLLRRVGSSEIVPMMYRGCQFDLGNVLCFCVLIPRLSHYRQTIDLISYGHMIIVKETVCCAIFAVKMPRNSASPSGGSFTF
jgi:hypothetical protein